MIITCPCKKKKFEIDAALIPDEGRTLKCGSCDEVWFYKNSSTFNRNTVRPYNSNIFSLPRFRKFIYSIS